MSEDIVAEMNRSAWTLELVHSPLKLLDDLNTRTLRVYMACVELYTKRVLGMPKDILAAFRGLSNLLGDRMGSPFLFGLPTSHFDLDLLWEAEGAMRPRLPQEEKDNIKFGVNKFPTWSWCGWIPPIPGGSHFRYNSSTIETCLENVHKWLKERTWIKWHIRDGHGILRSVWDGLSIADKDCTTDKQWRGYKRLDLSQDDSRYDSYGRKAAQKHTHSNKVDFRRTLPEYPYCVKIAERGTGLGQQLPDQRFLQFYTWSAWLRLLPPDSDEGSPNEEPQLRRYDIADCTGDWCETIVLDNAWGKENIKEKGMGGGGRGGT